VIEGSTAQVIRWRVRGRSWSRKSSASRFVSNAYQRRLPPPSRQSATHFPRRFL